MESLHNKSGKVQQKQQIITPDDSYTTTAKCSKNLRHQIACRNIKKNLEEDDDDTSSCSTSASADLSSDTDEIPVWVNNEQRYISGITKDTTCFDLIEALLEDECVQGKPEFDSKSPKDYVITERWKKVEQVLDGRTNILKIWNAWGSAQQEVKFSLRPFEGQFREMWLNSGDRDSGRGSPTGSINSAIVRRKRHKASKNSFAWMTHGQTIHPKSQKTNIERLMKLILEQGEIIQQQLSKLRDREVEIINIEDERHKLREKEHGKNYLLETYLKGLQDSAEEKESGVGNSDSGVHTEEATTSPEIAPSPLHDDETHQTSTNILQLEPKEKRTSNSSNINSNKSRSRRETELRIEHETIVKSLQQLSMKENEEEEEQGAMALPPATTEIAQQIEVLEKIVNINKQLQKEEELLVRLGAKIKRYEADATGLSEQQVLEALEKVNLQLSTGDEQLEKMDLDIKESDKMLHEKSIELKKLYDELEEVEVQHNRLSSTTPGFDQSLSIVPESDLNLSREYLAENMYNVSKTIYNGGSEFNASQFSPTSESINDMFVHPIEPPSQFGTPLTPTLAHAQIHTINDKASKTPISSPVLSDLNIPETPVTDALLKGRHSNQPNLLTNMNYLPTSLNKYHQRNINNSMTTATNLKLGPKKLINGVVMHELSTSNSVGSSSGTSNSSDTGMSSLGEQDFTQLGTLV